MARRYRDKLSWSYTLALLVVAGVVVYLLTVGYGHTANAQSTPQRIKLPPADSLMMVKGGDGIELDYECFKVNFNPELHIPNYVVWELTADETYGTIRRGSFQPDFKVKESADPRDYTGSGYDRGHMAPAGDMKFDPKAMERCFYMTNIVPQSHTLNGGTWNKLEEKCRAWARVDSAIIIICGPILSPKPTEFIGRKKVGVPHAFFKVVLAPYANPPRAIGFIMPNSRVDGGLQTTAVSVDSVEAATGLDFFSALPDSIEEQLESARNFHYWSTRR